MTEHISAELLLLRKRAATWILLGIWVTLGVFFAYVLPYVIEDAPDGIAEFLPRSLPGNLLEGFPFFGGVFALMLGVFAFGSEYNWGTLKTLYTQRPGRLVILEAKLAATGIVLAGFVATIFVAGAIASALVAQAEGASADWPPAWLLLRSVAAGWLMLAVWAALGMFLGVVTRGTSLAIGIGILYTLVVESLLSVVTDNLEALEPLSNLFVRANGYSLTVALGGSRAAIESSGPGSFAGPFVAGGQAVLVLVAMIAAFAAGTAALVRRRDVT
jgi:ABC-type transport system involved in multi-copper enzyme maturation permease subunit